MAKKTKQNTRKAPRARRAAARPAPAAGAGTRAQELLREGWGTALRALSAAEQEVEAQVKGLLKRNKITVDEAAALLGGFQARVRRERREGVRRLERQMKAIQARLKKEQRHVAKLAGEAVQGTLAALNIPSRREVSELTRKVDELSRKIDRLRRK